MTARESAGALFVATAVEEGYVEDMIHGWALQWCPHTMKCVYVLGCKQKIDTAGCVFICAPELKATTFSI